MKIKLDTAISAMLVVCAFVTTGVVLRREFIVPAGGKPERPTVLVPYWHDVLAKGMRIGPASAPVQLIEFADYECPYCGNFYKTLRAVSGRHPNQIALTYLNFPIRGHRFALPAARAAECANDQGRFEAMYDQLFEGQDQFDLKPWKDYATAAGVPDLDAFETCIKKTDSIPGVEEGKVLGAKLDVQGTPTIIVNGWRLGHPPTEAQLDQMVQRILAGKQPVDAKT